MDPIEAEYEVFLIDHGTVIDHATFTATAEHEAARAAAARWGVSNDQYLEVRKEVRK